MSTEPIPSTENKDSTESPKDPKMDPKFDKRVDKLFFQQSINHRRRYELLSYEFFLLILSLMIPVIIKYENIEVGFIPLIGIVYFIIFLIQIKFIPMKQNHLKSLLMSGLLLFGIKYCIDIIKVDYNINTTIDNLNYILSLFIIGYIYLLFAFKPKFRYILLIFRIIFVDMVQILIFNNSGYELIIYSLLELAYFLILIFNETIWKGINK